MGSLNGFLEHMDWFQLFLLLIGAVACLFCITFHELAHGFAAYQLGDPTAKVNGRLTLNPISHIDWIGLMLLLTVRVGWAKPVPVDMRNFRHPQRRSTPFVSSCQAADIIVVQPDSHDLRPHVMQ